MANLSGALPRRAVLWFRNDLRLHDNASLTTAAALVKKGAAEHVLPVYVFDPRHFGTTGFGSPKTGKYRARFLLESVQDLKEELRDLGSDLLIRVGHPEDVLPELASAGSTVLAEAAVASEETSVEARLKRRLGANAQLNLVWGSTLYHRDDLPMDISDIPDVFTPFRNAVEKKCTIRKPLPTPRQGELPLDATTGLDYDFMPSYETVGLSKDEWDSLNTPHENAVLPFKGGETTALARLKYYLWDSDLIADYFNIRNGMLGGDYSTKLSPWLAHGCISPLLIYEQIKKYERQRTENKSTYWVIFELIWRDYFRFFAMKHGNAIFQLEGVSRQKMPWKQDATLLNRWKEGQTGMPLVDANMRELLHTGFMSNRGRQNVASYLALDLGLDWRYGADHFESYLLDSDVCSNWGNWVSAAGLTGGRVNKFNILKQSKDYDADGDYVRAWLPELRKVPQAKIHAPWQMSQQEQEASGCIIGKDYPRPAPTNNQFGGSSGGGSRGRGGGRGARGDGGRRFNDGGGRGGRASGGRGPSRGYGKGNKRPSDFDMYG